MTPFPTGTVTFLLTDIEGRVRHALAFGKGRAMTMLPAIRYAMFGD